MGLIFFMVVYHHADNAGIVLSKKYSRHTWNILLFLQKN